MKQISNLSWTFNSSAASTFCSHFARNSEIQKKCPQLFHCRALWPNTRNNRWIIMIKTFPNTCRISKYSYVIFPPKCSKEERGKNPSHSQALKKNLSSLQTLPPRTEAHLTATPPKRHKRYIHRLQLCPKWELHCTHF